jgi:hypothetical protein
MEITHIKCIITSVAIRIDNAVRRYLSSNQRQQGFCFGVAYTLVKTLPARFKVLNTTTLPAAPRPRLPLRVPPK